MAITALDLSNMPIEQLEKLYSNMQIPTKEQKEFAWKVMDTGIYNEKGELVGDKLAEEDAY